MDHVNKTFESGLEIEKEPQWHYRKSAEMDREKKMNKLEEVNPEENILNNEDLWKKML